MNKVKTGALRLFGTILTFVCCSAFADTVVYNNFGPGDSFGGPGWIVGTSTATPTQPTFVHAMEFSPSQHGFLSTIEVGMGYLVAGNNAFTASIRIDNTGIPGAVLESINAIDQVSTINGVNGIVSLTASGATFLDASNTYWLVLEPINDFHASWIQNDQGVMGNRAFSTDFGTSWSTGAVVVGAFRISVADTVSTLTCSGFESPLADGPVTVKKNRALPFKGQLIDSNDQLVDNFGIVAPPVIQVIFDDAVNAAVDVSDDAISSGAGTDGNQFEFQDGKWQFNLKIKNFTAAGTYTATMESGDSTEYNIDPTCVGQFVIY